ncbi:MAG TPA: hypothetical protein DIC60_04390 [Lachnospiraceae bacterium]|nr:hypothetical protein [Lachnospiraceae bacterium]
MDIYYYNLGGKNNIGLPNGKVSAKELLCEKKRITNNKDAKLNELISFNLDLGSISHIPQNNPYKWEQALSTLVYIITGIVPNREEVLRCRQLYELLGKADRKRMTPEVLFGTFPYLAIAFKMNIEGKSHKGINILSNAIEFTSKLLQTDYLKINSFLCVQEERNDVGNKTVKNKIKEESVIKALNIFKGIIKNSPCQKGEVNWACSGGSEEGLSSLYPSIFTNYTNNEMLDNLKGYLNKHISDIDQVFKDNCEDGISLKIKNLDEFNKLVKKNCYTIFGSNFEKLDIIDVNNKELKNLILEAKRSLKRLEVYYNQQSVFNEKNERYIGQLEDQDIKNAARLFKKSSSMTFIAKVAMEVIFYYTWGVEARKENSIALGLSADHNSYQSAAFALGYRDSYHQASPILYGRSTIIEDGNERTTGEKGLNTFSLRQFWS